MTRTSADLQPFDSPSSNQLGVSTELTTTITRHRAVPADVVYLGVWRLVVCAIVFQDGRNLPQYFYSSPWIFPALPQCLETYGEWCMILSIIRLAAHMPHCRPAIRRTR